MFSFVCCETARAILGAWLKQHTWYWLLLPYSRFTRGGGRRASRSVFSSCCDSYAAISYIFRVALHRRAVYLVFGEEI